MSQRSSNSVRHSLIGGYIGEREDMGVGVRRRTQRKNGEAYRLNNLCRSIKTRPYVPLWARYLSPLRHRVPCDNGKTDRSDPSG
jgi:hypothetical protein